MGCIEIITVMLTMCYVGEVWLVSLYRGLIKNLIHVEAVINNTTTNIGTGTGTMLVKYDL